MASLSGAKTRVKSCCLKSTQISKHFKEFHPFVFNKLLLLPVLFCSFSGRNAMTVWQKVPQVAVEVLQ